MTLAQRLFKYSRAANVAEANLSKQLDKIYGTDIDEYTYDDYDTSLEVYGVTPVPWETLEPLGFALVWQHEHTGGRRLPSGDMCRCPVTRRGTK